MKKYYYAGGTRVAEREGSTLYWLLSDHLGSTSITATSSGSIVGELRYKPWGETRYTYGTTQTTIRYTGQREESSLGLYWYASRWYSPYITQFTQPDTIIPDPYNTLDWNRYSYVRYNPLKYSDPSGHFCYNSENNKFSDGDCFDDMQQELLDYFIEQLESGDYTDLELMENLINKALGLNSNAVIALRATSEIVRSSTPSGFGFSYAEPSKFFYEKHTEIRFDDSGFGDLMDTGTPNQVAHTIGIAYIAAYQERAGLGLLTNVLVWGNEARNIFKQSAKQSNIDADLGYIAADLGNALVANQSDAVSNAVAQIETYNYAEKHTPWWQKVKWPWSK